MVRRRGSTLAGMLILLAVLSAATLAAVGSTRDAAAIDLADVQGLRLRFAAESAAMVAARELGEGLEAAGASLTLPSASGTVVSATPGAEGHVVVVEVVTGAVGRSESILISP